MYIQAVLFENDELKIVDQTLIPGRLDYIKLGSIKETISAIRQLKVRGAPAIGITAAYAMYIAAKEMQSETILQFKEKLEETAVQLQGSRPTAVNLQWAIDRMRLIYHNNRCVSEIVPAMRNEALLIHEEDRNACQQMGKNGLAVIPKNPCTILTHCNAGSLATGGWGTALGVIYAAQQENYQLHVYATETRPLGQGARLTFFELMQQNIPCTLITDSTVASLMASGKIDLVLFGADRIARNGDVANKIGTCALALLAKVHSIPCYAVAPASTFDLSIASGDDIPIEERQADEILSWYQYQLPLPKHAAVYNPAFDVTKAEDLSGIITEKGIIKKPYEETIIKNIKSFM
jgi:methylthioribose-1-phosphate isomerase